MAAHKPTHKSWGAMMGRCFAPGNCKYARYAGRGITVCERWKDFSNFVVNMGERPPGTSLDRIDNDGNYEPGNCRWADAKTQARGNRSKKIVTFDGKSLSLSSWSEVTGIPIDVLRMRFNLGWTPERIITQPVQIHRKRCG